MPKTVDFAVPEVAPVLTFLLGGKNVDTLGHLDLREAFTGQDCAD